ncbi:MAG: AIR synthase related protein [Candidatus Thorarchaeota archaeon]
MEEGKLSWKLLKEITSNHGVIGEGVIQGPQAGCDVAVFDFQLAKKRSQEFYGSDKEVYVVFKTDPITFPTPEPGRYAVIINSNDIVTSGALPYAFNATILVPPECTPDEVKNIQIEIHRECLKLGITILGGHTEVSASVDTPIISGAMIGFVPKDYFISRKIGIGDVMVCVGWCAKEGVGIVISEGFDELSKKLSREKLAKLLELGYDISVYDIALKINKKYQPGLIHDATEGGILGAAYETIATEDFGLELDSKNFPFTKETIELFQLLDVDVLRVISSGALLVVLPENKAEELIKESTDKVPIKIVGRIVSKEKGIRLDGQLVDPPSSDAVIDALIKIEKGSF